jgi:hypothetical protein
MRKIVICLVFLGLWSQVWADEFWVVKEKDTLWNICERYYGNPFLWPKLWQINSHLTNPHWIYPGDILWLKETPEELIEAAKKIKVAKVEEEEEFYPLTWRFLESAGYLSASPESPSGKILQALGEKNRETIADRDIVYVEFKKDVIPQQGSEWTIFRVSPPIKHPVTHKKVGYLHQILGVVKLIEVYPILDADPKNRGLTWTKAYPQVAKAEVIRCYDVIYVNDFIKPYKPPKPSFITLYKEKPPSLRAWIVATKDRASEVAFPHVIYIDVGEEQGLKPGQTLGVFRREEKINIPPLPLGEVLIIKTTPQTATAIITKSKYTFQLGDEIGLGQLPLWFKDKRVKPLEEKK